MEAFSWENHGTVVNFSAHVCLPKANWKPWIYMDLHGFMAMWKALNGLFRIQFSHPVLELMGWRMLESVEEYCE